jgi:gliding motility-associated-like protein
MPIYSKAQHLLSGNLCPNPSFEEYTNCPSNQGDIFKASPWFNGCAWNPDYFNSCSTSNSFGTPVNFGNNYQIPKSGEAYAGLTLFQFNNDNVKEYIGIKLFNDLKNRRYCADFWVSFNATFYSIDLIGMFFSSIVIDCSNKNTIFGVNPQIMNKNGNNLNDTLNWEKISGQFIANGTEEFLYIGNFSPDTLTAFQLFNNNYPFPFTYYFIDDVSVCECSFDINLGPDTSLCESETIILMPNLPNASYTWQDSSHTATYEVKQPGTYWVRAFVAEYDIYSTDTIVITAGDDSFCNPPITIPNIITPNGDSQNDNFVIQNAETYDIALQIYNRWGVLIHETISYQNDFSCKECADGVYFYILKAKSKRNGREKEYKGSLTIING